MENSSVPKVKRLNDIWKFKFNIFDPVVVVHTYGKCWNLGYCRTSSSIKDLIFPKYPFKAISLFDHNCLYQLLSYRQHLSPLLPLSFQMVHDHSLHNGPQIKTNAALLEKIWVSPFSALDCADIISILIELYESASCL